MAVRGRPALSEQDRLEVLDLYKWGMQGKTLCMFYDISKSTLRLYVLRAGMKLRPAHGPPKHTPLRTHNQIKSSRPQIPVGVRYSENDQSIDLLLREAARALRDTRIEQHQ